LRRLAELNTLLLPVITLTGLAAGAIVHLTDASATAGDTLWALTAALCWRPSSWDVARDAGARRCRVDLIALIAIAGALALEEFLAAAVVALMLSGGNALERAAARRSRRELTALLARAPQNALVRREGELVEVPVVQVGPGDQVVVRPGEVVPVDGTIAAGEATLDDRPSPASRCRC